MNYFIKTHVRPTEGFLSAQHALQHEFIMVTVDYTFADFI